MIKRRPIDPIFGEVKQYTPPEPTLHVQKETSPPPALEHRPPAIFSKIPELRILAKEVGGESLQWTWQYPGAVNGQPREQKNRHLYNHLLKSDCPYCHESVPTYIDFARLTAGPHCPECNGHQLKPEVITHSYLQYELERKPRDAIRSDFQGYIADDPLLASEALWNRGGIFHLGAPMGSGKTTLIYHRAREAAETGALTLIVVPRISLAKGVHADLKADTTLGWGLNHQGSGRDQIGEYGAIATMGRLPRLIQKIVTDFPNHPIRIFVDELDFAGGLLLASIFKELSQDIKYAIRERKDTIGIVTAGQTASTIGLEAIAKELDCDLKGYYLSPRPAEHQANLFIVDTTEVEQGRNRIIQAVIDKAESVITTGKKCYIFGDERRSAQIIAKHFGDKALLYDAYNKKSPDIAEFHRLTQLPEDKMVLIATPAVDVGVSLQDENAETIVFSVENPLNTNGVSSTVQQCQRNRQKPPLSIYLMKYQNALPLAPKQAIDFQTQHAKQKLSSDETTPEGLIAQLGIKDAMRSLEADQPEIFFTYHLHQAGYQVQEVKKDWEAVNFEQVQSVRKQIKDSENEQVKAMAKVILCPEHLLTAQEIENKDWEQLQPAPIIQLAHERANELLRDAGWNGEVERFVDEGNQIVADPVQAFKDADVTDEMWLAARAANEANLSTDKIKRWMKGYLTIHFPDAAFSEFEASREFEIHHRRDDIFIGSLVKALLSKLPRTPAPMDTVGQVLIDVAQKTFGTDRFSALLKDGSVSPRIAAQLRFIDLGRNAIPTKKHFDFLKDVISEHYPARIAKVGDLYQLAAPKNTEQVDAFMRLMRCLAKRDDDDIDPEPENGDLTPPPAADPRAGEKELAIQMRNNGYSQREAARHTGTPRSTIQRWENECHMRPTDFPGPAYIENEWATPSMPESSETRATTESDPYSAEKAISLISETPPVKSVKPISEKILGLLADGEKTTKAITDSIDAKYNSITDELKRLVDQGEIIKVKRGIYDLPSRALSIDLRLESITTWSFTTRLVTAEQERAKCHAYVREDMRRERTSPIDWDEYT